FHRWARERHEHLGLRTADDNLEVINRDLPFFARAYLRILEASRTYTRGLEPVFYNAHNDFTWQNTVLLAPLVTSDNEDIVRRKLAAMATYLDIWIMRRAANYVRVTYSSTAYAMFILCRDLRRKPLNDLIDALHKKLAEDEVTFRGATNKNRTGIAGFGINVFSRRYVFHLLARLTAFTDVGSGKPDLFDKYVDRTPKNPFDIEHVWANDYEPYKSEFTTPDEFQRWRNHVAGLLLLPADVNRSYKDKPFEQKAPHYAKHNLYAASLTPSAYEHQPQFEAFRSRLQLPFKAYTKFGKTEQEERRSLLEKLVEEIWSPKRLEEYRP
ncbi:HNH endonuclease, partial [bacterium]